MAEDRTPGRDEGDSTPVYGSLESSVEEEQEEWRQELQGAGPGVQELQGAGLGVQELHGARPAVQEQDQEAYVSAPALDVSYEVARPPSPEALGVVEELQEEEGMDWEGGDRELLLQESHRVRALVTCGEEQEGMEVEEEDVRGVGVRAAVVRAVVVVDTNVLLSSLPLVGELAQDPKYAVYLPWQVFSTCTLHPAPCTLHPAPLAGAAGAGPSQGWEGDWSEGPGRGPLGQWPPADSTGGTQENRSFHQLPAISFSLVIAP